MAGMEAKDTKGDRHREKLKEAYVGLGKVCIDLSFTKNVIHSGLEIEYAELEAVLKKIERLEGH